MHLISHIFKNRVLGAGLALLVTFSAQIVLSEEESKPVAPDLASEGWVSLFDGKSMTGWKTTNFAGGGEAQVKDGSLEIDMGLALSGVQYTNQPPRINYEITLEAMKRDGGDFFCGLTMPYKDEHCTFICGGWGGGVVGLSSINGMDASENQTTEFKKFDKNQWYRISLRVLENRIQGWIDQKLFLDVDTTEVSIGMRIGEIEESAPLGIATWMTSSSLRDIRLREVKPDKH